MLSSFIRLITDTTYKIMIIFSSNPFTVESSLRPKKKKRVSKTYIRYEHNYSVKVPSWCQAGPNVYFIKIISVNIDFRPTCYKYTPT